MGLRAWRLQKLKERGVDWLYYIAPIDNVPSIMRHGILPKNRADQLPGGHRTFAEASVQQRRATRQVLISDQSTKLVHELVPLYLNSRTPTLWARRSQWDELTILKIDCELLSNPGLEFAFCDGNAGSAATRFYWSLNKLNAIPWDVIRADFWSGFDDGKRRRSAEFLVFPDIGTPYCENFLVYSEAAKQRVEASIGEQPREIRVTVAPEAFEGTGTRPPAHDDHGDLDGPF